MYCGPIVISEVAKRSQPHYKKLHFYNAMTLRATTIARRPLPLVAVRPQRVKASFLSQEKAGRLQIFLLCLPFLLVILSVISQSLTPICSNPFLTALEQETFSFPFSYLFLCFKNIAEQPLVAGKVYNTKIEYPYLHQA